MKLKRLKTVAIYWLILSLCSGCVTPQKLFNEVINCSVIKDQFQMLQQRISEGEGVVPGITLYKSEAEIREALDSNLNHYKTHWRSHNCEGSLTETDQIWRRFL